MIFGITMGDSSGVGPEIVLKAYANGEIRPDVVVFGDLAVLEYCNEVLGYGVPLRKIKNVQDHTKGFLNVLDFGLIQKNDIAVGKISKPSGQAAREYVVAATQAALNHETAAIVTLPMNKEATQLSDPDFCGHTELVAGLCGVQEYAMMLVSDQLIVSHVSTHTSMEQAVRHVKKERIIRLIELTFDTLIRLVGSPRVAVAGLNPHAGEHGLFGRQEIEEIAPAVEWAREQGYSVEGPIPPDTVFYSTVRKKRYDAVVCMYHDQGHIPIKLLDFEGGINLTLGLPIVRTSVDHGTAFDIAYKGECSTRSFVAALELANKLVASGY